MGTELLLPLGLAVMFLGLIGALGTIALAARDRQEVARRQNLLENYRAAPVPLRRQELEVPFGERVLGPLTERFVGAGRRLTPDERMEKIRTRLDLAGNPPGWDVDRILGLKALGLVVGTLAGIIVPTLFGAGARGVLLTTLALALLGWFGPTMWIYQVGYDRTEAIQRELPDALDLLTISVEAGLAFDAALTQVARNSDGALGKELFRVLQEMQIGTGRIDALRALAERTDVDDLRVFVGAMVQADSFGIPIANVLRVQSKEMRVKRSQRAEEKAQKVPVKILFPLVFCILPALFVVVIGPAGIKIFQQFGGLRGPMARLLIVSRSMALAMRLADQHEVVEHPADELDDLLPHLHADVLVLDVGDPILAVNTVNSLREAEHGIPVLLVSGYQPEWEQVEAQQVEGVQVVPLPITRVALLQGVAILTGQKLLSTEDGATSLPAPPPIPAGVPIDPRFATGELPAADDQPSGTGMPAPTGPRGSTGLPTGTGMPVGRATSTPTFVGPTPPRGVTIPPAPPLAPHQPTRPYPPLPAGGGGWSDVPPGGSRWSRSPATEQPPPPPPGPAYGSGLTAGRGAAVGAVGGGMVARRMPRLGSRPRKLQRRPGPVTDSGAAPSGLVTDPLGPRTDPAGFGRTDLDRRLDAAAAAPLVTTSGLHDGGFGLGTEELVRMLRERVGDLYGVSDTAQVLADDVIERADADAAAILVPDGPVWRVSGGVGLRPLERRLVLEPSHWLITEIGSAGRAVLIEDTDIIRQQLSGAPLAAWRHLLAVPVPDVQAIVVLARGQEGGPFADRELSAVIAPVREAAALLAAAVETRRLARALSPLREQDDMIPRASPPSS